jgi:hypothetical protein
VDGSMAPAPVTDGFAPSTRPTWSDDGNIVAFQSQADLPGDKSDMGIPQVFIYDTKSKTSAQLTFDPGGCTDPVVTKVRKDWRVGFLCGGEARFYMIRADVLSRIDTLGAAAAGFAPELGKFFVVVSTTGALLAGSGTTAGHQVYMLNLFKRPAFPISGAPTAVWFPTRGINPL